MPTFSLFILCLRDESYGKRGGRIVVPVRVKDTTRKHTESTSLGSYCLTATKWQPGSLSVSNPSPLHVSYSCTTWCFMGLLIQGVGLLFLMIFTTLEPLSSNWVASPSLNLRGII